MADSDQDQIKLSCWEHNKMNQFSYFAEMLERELRCLKIVSFQLEGEKFTCDISGHMEAFAKGEGVHPIDAFFDAVDGLRGKV